MQHEAQTRTFGREHGGLVVAGAARGEVVHLGPDVCGHFVVGGRCCRVRRRFRYWRDRFVRSFTYCLE